MDNNNFGQELAKQTLDQIPQANSNAKRIVGLVKEGGRITGYQLSDNSIVEKQQAVDMARAFLILSMRILVPLFRLPHSFRCSFRNWQGS